MGRRAASDALSELAFAAELLGEACPFDVDSKTISGLAWNVRGTDKAQLGLLPGMTPLLFAVVDDALNDRAPVVLADLKRLLPAGLFELRRVKGLGPKKVQKLWRDLGVESLGELEYACRENRLTTIAGFGDKTQAAILEQLAALSREAGLMRRDHAQTLVLDVVEALKDAGARVEVAGALRRGMELVDEVVVVSTIAPTVALPPRVQVVVADAARFGTVLVASSSSSEHLAALRARATSKGLVFDDVAAADEAAVYAALGLVAVDAEQRDGSVLIEQGRALPKLITRADLQGALHNHTTASDGVHDVVTMLNAAGARGLKWLGISDHSEAAAYAHGLDARRLKAQADELRAADGTAGVRVLSGIEADIMADGALDLADSALSPLQVVVASMHQRYGLRGAAMTARLVRAARHPLVDIIGHPTGRLLLSRPPADFDVSALLHACELSGCAVELNANPARLDLAEQWLREAKARGVLVSIAADAHAADELDNLDHGIALARRAGLTADDVLNTRSADDVLAWVAHRRAHAQTATTTTTTKNAGFA